MQSTGPLLVTVAAIASLMFLSGYSSSERAAKSVVSGEVVQPAPSSAITNGEESMSLSGGVSLGNIRTLVATAAPVVAVANRPPAAMERSPTGTPSPELSTLTPNQVVELHRDVSRLQRRVITLEAQLAAAGDTNTPATAWLESIPIEFRPKPDDLRQLSEFMQPYPVELTRQEGEWVVARIQSNDWLSWGPSIDEALILYLGPHRLADDLPPDVLASLVAEWEEEGHFN